MKGVSLMGDMFLLLAMIAVTILVTLFLWYLILIYEVIVSPAGLSTPRDVTLRVLLNPTEYDSTMLAFLESTYEGISMKRILNAVAIQGSTDIWLDGKSIDAAEAAESLTSMIDSEFILKISPQEIYLVQSGTLLQGNTPIGIHKVVTPLFLLDGEQVELQLLVRS